VGARWDSVRPVGDVHRLCRVRRARVLHVVGASAMAERLRELYGFWRGGGLGAAVDAGRLQPAGPGVRVRRRGTRMAQKIHCQASPWVRTPPRIGLSSTAKPVTLP